MTRLCIFGLTCIILNSACGQSKIVKHVSQNNASKKLALKFDTSKIAIFNLKTDWWLSEKFDGAKSFNLTGTDLEAVDEIFKKSITQNNIDTSYFHYKKQYVPFIDKDRQKKVWINCFCSDLDNEFLDWRKSIVIVSDGGSCFFNLIINLSNHSFSNLQVNGVG